MTEEKKGRPAARVMLEGPSLGEYGVSRPALMRSASQSAPAWLIVIVYSHLLPFFFSFSFSFLFLSFFFFSPSTTEAECKLSSTPLFPSDTPIPRGVAADLHIP